MAILKQCCCWNNVRSGSLASGIYTLIFSLICIAIDLYNVVYYGGFDMEEITEYQAKGLRVLFYVMLSIYILIASLSIVLIVGVHKDSPSMLLPWIHALILFMLLELACTVYIFVESDLDNTYWFSLFELVFYIGRTILNIYCVLCVISQYQELKAGRGRLQDISRPMQHVVVYQSGMTPAIIGSTIPPGGTVVIQPMRSDQNMAEAAIVNPYIHPVAPPPYAVYAPPTFPPAPPYQPSAVPPSSAQTFGATVPPQPEKQQLS
ncbi:uncharacterized protein [Ptychodera flava]|uniref:uncharacterized protein n=1 Tax=Ptychodera flava TaxID=63121 RepID=UPI003969D6AD